MTPDYRIPPHRPAGLALIVVALAFLVAMMMAGCTGPLIQVDKSVHVHAAPFSVVKTSTTNTSDTQADGNTASAEAGLTLPLVP